MDKFIDLNADTGEASTPDWAASEAAIMDYISSANIACGGHAGDMDTMVSTAKRAQESGVSIGAHPSYPDRKNFGRLELTLGEDIDPKILSESLYEQIARLMDAAKGEVKYVKPHGALYNQAVKAKPLAALIGDVILRIDSSLSWLGGPSSEMTQAAQERGLSFIGEGFIDRQYSEDGHLVARTLDGAVIHDQEARLAQALSLAKTKHVTSRAGQNISIDAGSLCVHGDSAGAVETARLTRDALIEAGFDIRAFA